MLKTPWTKGFATGLILAFPFPAPGSAVVGHHRVPRLDGEVRIDGRLDEPAWDQALKLEITVEVSPAENVPAPVRTEVGIFTTASHFVAGFVAYDPDPSAIRARLSDRDDVSSDDWVGLVLDTFDDARRSLTFLVNPRGVQADLIETPDASDDAWDTIWESAGRITGEGYVVEIAIPFSSLRFQRTDGEQVWGFDALRSYPRNVRHQMGLFARDRSNNCYLCQADKLAGFAGAKPGKSLEIVPTVSAIYAQERESGTEGPFREREKDLDLGVTASWGVTSNLTLAATVHPDFSQVESDAAQLEINRQFALFFPEKRPFFLESADYFNTRINAVHTRSVADPVWGFKLTGKVGRGAIGVFSVRDSLTNYLFPGSQSSELGSSKQAHQSTALRYRYDIGKSSTVGLLVTDREGEGEYHNRVGGFDLDLRPTPTDIVQFQALGSWTAYPSEIAEAHGQPGGELRDLALNFAYSHRTRTHEYYFASKDVGSDFRADLGFEPQAGYRFYDSGYLHRWQHDDPQHWYNSLRVWAGYEYTDDHEGNKLRSVAGGFVRYDGPLESSLYALLYLGDRTYQGIEMGHDTLSLTGSIQPTATLGFGLEAFVGDEVDYAGVRAADRLTLAPSVTVRTGDHLRLTLTHQREELDVDEGTLYRADVSDLRVIYQLNVRCFVRAILQNVDYRFHPEHYKTPVDERFRHLLSQLLFSYEINPQTAFYLGYADNYAGNRGHDLRQTDRTVFFKVGYALLF